MKMRRDPGERKRRLLSAYCGRVNPADPLIVSGKYAKEFGTHLPLIPGYDVAGVVEKTGATITKLKIGDPIYAYVLWGGGWAEYAVATEGEATAKPKSLNFTDSAAVPLVALTAWQALVDTAKLERGPNGSYSRRLRRRRKFRHSNRESARRESDRDGLDQNQDLLKQLGADVAIDYTKTKFEDVAKDVDVVLDPVGKIRSRVPTAW